MTSAERNEDRVTVGVSWCSVWEQGRTGSTVWVRETAKNDHVTGRGYGLRNDQMGDEKCS